MVTTSGVGPHLAGLSPKHVLTCSFFAQEVFSLLHWACNITESIERTSRDSREARCGTLERAWGAFLQNPWNETWEPPARGEPRKHVVVFTALTYQTSQAWRLSKSTVKPFCRTILKRHLEITEVTSESAWARHPQDKDKHFRLSPKSTTSEASQSFLVATEISSAKFHLIKPIVFLLKLLAPPISSGLRPKRNNRKKSWALVTDCTSKKHVSELPGVSGASTLSGLQSACNPTTNSTRCAT